jgi:hypothetical protein
MSFKLFTSATKINGRKIIGQVALCRNAKSSAAVRSSRRSPRAEHDPEKVLLAFVDATRLNGASDEALLKVRDQRRAVDLRSPA